MPENNGVVVAAAVAVAFQLHLSCSRRSGSRRRSSRGGGGRDGSVRE